MEIFKNIPKIEYEGPKSKNPLAFKYYDAEKMVLGKKMKEHLPFAMAWWHNLCATGADMFGRGTANMFSNPRFCNGAAIFAMVWAKEYESVEIAAEKFIRIKEVVLPDKTLAEKYEKGYAHFKRLYPALKDCFV